MLEAAVWAKCVVSPALIENLSQLMMAPLLLATVKTLAVWLKLAVPLTTVGFTGLACAWAEMKHAATAAAPRRTEVDRRREDLRGVGLL